MLNNTELDYTIRTNKETALPSNQLIVTKSQVTAAPTLTKGPSPTKKKNTFFRNEDKFSRLEKYEEIDRQDPLNAQFVPPQGFKGPVINRKATDKNCIFLFLIIYSLLGVYSYFVLVGGNPDRLANGMDFRGELCGIDGLSTKPYLYYAGPVVDIKVGWCVRQCPPSSGRETCMYDIDHITPTKFCYIQMQADRMARYCIPKEPNSRAIVLEDLGSLRNVMRRVSSDLWLSWDVTLVGFGLSILLAYFFTVLAKYEKIVGPLIWGGIILAQGSFVVFGWMSWLEADRTYNFRCIPGTDPNTCGGQSVLFFQVLAIVIVSFGAVYMLVMGLLCRRINRGIGLLKAAQHIMQVLGQIRAFPIIVVFLGTCVCGLGFYLVINAMTIGDIRLARAKYIDGHLLYAIFYNTPIQIGIIFVVFCVLFTLTLILTLNDMFTSYALSIWFFTKQKDTVRIPFLFSLKILLRYHFGTCVFIAINLMFLTIPQSIMDYTKTLLRALPQKSSCVRYSQACCMGCIHAFEVFLRYISKHSVIQVAIWSDPYYESAKKAYFLLFRNADKIKDLDFLQTLIVFQLRLCTSFLASIPVYLYVNYADSTFMGKETNEIETPLIPTLYVFVCGMFFSNVFQGSYDITSKTIIQLFLLDSEMFFGEQRFVEPFIREFMEVVGKITDEDWKIGFTRQIKFDIDRYKKELEYGSQNSSSYEQAKGEDSDEEDEINESKYSDQQVDYDEKKGENNNPFIGLPTDFKPNQETKQQVQEELGNQSQTMIVDQTIYNNTSKQLRLKTPVLNTSQQSFQILLNQNDNDKSQISQISEKPEKQKQQFTAKKQRF